MLWHPTKLEIQDWFNLRLQEFAKAENQNPKLTTDAWLARYIHDGPHKWFLCEFPIILYEWLVRFAYKKHNFQGGESASQTPKLIRELQETDNKALQAVEVWLDTILEGYITESVVDTNKAYSEAIWEFFNGPRGMFLLSL